MGTLCPDVIAEWRQSISNLDIIVKGPVVGPLATNAKIAPQSAPMRAGYNLVGIGYRIRADVTSSATQVVFNDWLGNYVFEDLIISDMTGRKKYNYRDPGNLKNVIVTFNDELILHPYITFVNQHDLEDTYYESQIIPVTCLDGSSSYYQIEIETGTLSNMTSTITGLDQAWIQFSYYYSKITPLDFATDSHSFDLVAGVNDLQNIVSQGHTQIFYYTGFDDVNPWDWVHPYNRAVSDIDDVDFSDPYGNYQKCDGWDFFLDFYNKYVEEYHTIMPLPATTSMPLVEAKPSKNFGLDVYSIIQTFSPEPFYASRVSDMRLEMDTAHTSIHLLQVMLENYARIESANPPAELATAGGNIVFPTPSTVIRVPVASPASTQTVHSLATQRPSKRRKINLRR